LFDEVIERRVGRMQKVIELARVCRERRAIGLKSPLKTLVVIHRDPLYLEDIKGLEAEICGELNVLNLVLSQDEDKYDVQYSANADWPILGKKLKKDVGKVKKALPDLTTHEVRTFLETGKITVAGIELISDDLIVRRSLKESDASKNQEFNTDSDVLVIQDVELHPELAQQGLAREIINRVQRLRKKAGLVPTDDVGMEYCVLSDPDNTGLEKVFETQTAMIEKALRRPMDKHVVTEVEGKIPKGKNEVAIAEEEQEVLKATFLLRLVKL
jgi:isoleucyl-tRNA synthetase